MRVHAPSADLDCFVYVEREGVLSRMGHDVKLRVTRAWVDVTPSEVRAVFDAASLEVACAIVNGHEDASALSARDRASIAENVTRDVLDARRHPEIAFTSTLVTEARIEGTLRLCGQSRPVHADVTRIADARGERVVASCSLNQLEFGIRPYTAMLGALKVKPAVRVVVALAASALDTDTLGAAPS